MKLFFSSFVSVIIFMNELVINFGDDNMQFLDGMLVCFFGIVLVQGGINVFGDIFLRSVYVVYDFDNNEIFIVQIKYNVFSSNIVEIKMGKDVVLSVVDVSSEIVVVFGLFDQGE